MMIAHKTVPTKLCNSLFLYYIYNIDRDQAVLVGMARQGIFHSSSHQLQSFLKSDLHSQSKVSDYHQQTNVIPQTILWIDFTSN